jgi:hypothetical protein
MPIERPLKRIADRLRARGRSDFSSIGLPIAIIRMPDRDIYLDALATAGSGDLLPFQALVSAAIAESLRRAISFFS